MQHHAPVILGILTGGLFGWLAAVRMLGGALWSSIAVGALVGAVAGWLLRWIVRHDALVDRDPAEVDHSLRDKSPRERGSET